MVDILYPNIYFWIIVILFTLSSSGYTYEIIRNKAETWKMDLTACAFIYTMFVLLIFMSSTQGDCSLVQGVGL